MKTVALYDTTLRDGAQTEGISFSLEDKIKVAHLLDDFGIAYIEGGWPGSNPKDMEFYARLSSEGLKRAKLAAFGSTRRANTPASKDMNLAALLKTSAPAVTIFGKTWDYHVKNALKTTLEENLLMIRDSVAFLKDGGREVIYDAEHFFDGYKANPDYALRTVSAAVEGGADVIVFCDTNGGTITHDLEEIIQKVSPQLKAPFGVHLHNDCDLAVASSLAAVRLGAVQVQGTINGYGERCGNANLCSLIPTLVLKMGIPTIAKEKVEQLTELAHHVSEIVNRPVPVQQPYVGRSAFAHKGGVHVSAILQDTKTYEHMDPALVGNTRHLPVSELSGVNTLIHKAQAFGVDLSKENPETKALLAQLKDLENKGFHFEEGEASFELLVKRHLKTFSPFFTFEGFKIISDKMADGTNIIEASIKVRVNGNLHHTAAEGDGPVNALDNALRKALTSAYPEIKTMKLTDYKVRVLDSKEATAANVRVLIESCDETHCWGTVGVSTNIIEASWQALVDSVEYKLLKERAETAKGRSAK